MRNLGDSVGIAMLSTVVQFREQVHFSTIAEALSQNSLKVQDRLQALSSMFAGRGSDSAHALQQGAGLIAQQVRLNASVQAYSDAFWMLGICILASLATLLILRKPNANAALASVDAH